MPDFRGASYARALQFALPEITTRNLYTVGSVLMSPRTASDTGEFSELGSMTSRKNLVTTLAGHVAAEAARQ